MNHENIEQGDVYWISISEDNEDEIIHPHVVIQDNIINNSRIDTVIVCGISTNMKRAYDPGNIILDIGEANLNKKSIIVVSQISTVKKVNIGEYIGKLGKERIQEIFEGMKQIQNIRNA